jgi:hypothetical protein
MRFVRQTFPSRSVTNHNERTHEMKVDCWPVFSGAVRFWIFQKAVVLLRVETPPVWVTKGVNVYMHVSRKCHNTLSSVSALSAALSATLSFLVTFDLMESRSMILLLKSWVASSNCFVIEVLSPPGNGEEESPRRSRRTPSWTIFWSISVARSQVKFNDRSNLTYAE